MDIRKGVFNSVVINKSALADTHHGKTQMSPSAPTDQMWATVVEYDSIYQI